MAPRSQVLLILGLAALAALVLYVAFPNALRSPAPEQQGEPSAALPQSASPAGTQLLVATPLEGRLTPGETHTYRIEAQAGDFLHVVVDQQGVDVSTKLLDAAGRELVQSDRPIDYIGPEPLLAFASMAGSYLVKITAANREAPTGEYSVRLEELHPATERERRRAGAARLFSHADASYWDRDYTAAISQFAEVLAAWRDLGDRSWQAATLERLGQAHAKLRQWRQAEEYHRQAADLFRDLADVRWEAIVRNLLAQDYYFLWDLDRAVESYRQAIDLRKAAGDLPGEALTTVNMARVFQDQDEIQLALDANARALDLIRSQDRRLRAQILHNLGALHLELGRTAQARQKLEAAEKAWSELGNQRRRSASLNQLGKLFQRQGEMDRALGYYREALKIRRDVEDRRSEAVSLSSIGSVHQARGATDMALEHFRNARAILRELDHPYSEAGVLLNLGSLYCDREQPEEALDFYRQSRALYRRVGDSTGEAESLAGVARAAHLQGDLFAALEASDQALEIFESVRPRAVRHEFRASFFATVQKHFEYHIDLLMELHRRESNADYDARALLTSERARARSLLDLLTEAKARPGNGVAPAMVEREKSLQRRLNSSAYRRLRLRNNPNSEPDQLRQADQAVERALDALEELRGEIRKRHPRYAALTNARVLNLAQIQRETLGPGTLLLEYWLGDKQSFLWAATPDSLTSFELPGREAIDRLARTTYGRLIGSRHDAHSSRTALCELARMILLPAAAQIRGKERLLIVGDGALLYIPFAALPEPDHLDRCQSAPPLVTGHEITHLPSASALAILRHDLENRPAPRFTVAVVADPVFDTSDDRLASPRSEQSAGDETIADAALRSATTNLGAFRRLRFSRQEANAILDLVAEEERLSALGFDANKAAVRGDRLSDFRIVHFATHGILNAEQPELSGIVLSLVDREGRPRDGFLRTHEVYNLDLASDLVVLSACQTALGKEIRGEGLVGLTRGFLYAGTARMMVSLWNVNDQSTAELMKRFYSGLLQDGLRPAAALRAAQVSMSHDETWGAPFYWAGFVIQGEWR